MNGKRVFEWLFGAVIMWIVVVMMASATCDLVGGRGQDSTEMHGGPVTTATPQASSSPALVPAPSNRAVGETVVGAAQSDLTDVVPRGWDSSSAAPASTVTQSALTATVTATVVIDPVPATPPAQRVPAYSYAPWPEYLWPVVACLVGRESGGNPGAVGGQGERGLLQIGVANFAYLATYGITPDMLFDGPTNIRAGWIISLYWQKATGDGFAPWASTRGGCANG